MSSVHSKRLGAIITVLALVFLSGCQGLSGGEKEVIYSPLELQRRIIDANSRVSTYKLLIEMQGKYVLRFDGETHESSSSLRSRGAVDMLNRRMRIENEMKMSVMGRQATLKSEVYAVGDYIYSRTGRKWVKVPFDRSLWEGQTQFDMLLKLFDGASIFRHPEEYEGNKTFYVIQVTPDRDKLVQLLVRSNPHLSSQITADNLRDVIKSYQITLWADKETFLVEKERVKARMAFKPQELGLSMDEYLESHIEVETDAYVRISDIDCPASIELPESAKGASLAEKLPGQQGIIAGDRL